MVPKRFDQIIKETSSEAAPNRGSRGRGKMRGSQERSQERSQVRSLACQAKS